MCMCVGGGEWGEGGGGGMRSAVHCRTLVVGRCHGTEGGGGAGACERGMRERERKRMLRRRWGDVRSIRGGECHCAAPFEIRWKWAAAEGGGPELQSFELNFGI